MNRFDGRCHCGNIRIEYTLPDDVDIVPARACGCDFCTRHGGTYTSNPNASLEIFVDEEGLVSRYQFGTKTAEFIVCQRCGVVPVVTSRIDGQLYAVVNVNAFVDNVELDLSKSDFDGETQDSRLARRRKNWIAKVSFVADAQKS